MHYANGREAKIGDRIVGKDVSGNPLGGIIIHAIAETDKCNLSVVDSWTPYRVATAKECLHVDDVLPK